MLAIKRDRGSFRDPSGYVFVGQTDVWRTVNNQAVDAYQAVEATGLFRDLVARGLVIETVSEPSGYGQFVGARGEQSDLVLRHPRLPLISYPYEWTFGQLRDAALAHLDVQIAAFGHGVVLSDATAYNMQFASSGPMHIDVLSFRPYRDGEVWSGYNQFCRQFLFPLLLEAWAGVAFQPFLRACIDGVSLSDANTILPLSKRWLSPSGLMHVTLQARAEAHYSSGLKTAQASMPTLSKGRYLSMLTEMRVCIAGLRSGRRSRTFWNSYAADNSYSDPMQVEKHDFIERFVRENAVSSVWDLGGNSGDYSVAAINAGATRAVVMDTDLDSLEAAYARRAEYPGLLPLVMDCADPSPNRGWAQKERKGLVERAEADAVFALALVHHMAIGKNIPLAEVVHWIVGLAPAGVIEFVPKTDPMVRQMLLHRDDVFHDYDEANFLAALGGVATVTRQHRFAQNDRLIVEFARASGAL